MSQNLGAISPSPLSHFANPHCPLTCDVIYGFPLTSISGGLLHYPQLEGTYHAMITGTHGWKRIQHMQYLIISTSKIIILIPDVYTTVCVLQEKLVHGFLIAGGILITPAWILTHLKHYQSRD